MGISTGDSVLDAALDKIAGADRVCVCEGQPATYAEATTNKGTGANKKLGDVAAVGGDFTKADGDTSGRKLTFGGKTEASVDATTGVEVTGSADHLAYVDDAGSELLHVTTVPTQTLTAGNDLVLEPQKVIEIPDTVAA